MKFLCIVSIVLASGCSTPQDTTEIKKWKEQAERVTIIRDNYGVPHIYGKTDADAVFGMMYAQCEESFERVERNYLEVLGMLSETEGDAYVSQDLQMKIIYDTAEAKSEYQKAAPWLKKLLDAFAGGINYYLYKHPRVKPVTLTHFEPWFPLLFTDGAYISINTGGLQPEDVKELYGNGIFSSVNNKPANEQSGSNAFAIAPSRSANGNAMLYINPHVSFYFRTEVHIVSDEGLNAYGAATWGQFFIFQGFNQHCGWMHTASMVDVADLYEEKITRKENHFLYEYDGELKPVTEKKIFIPHKKNGGIIKDSITVYNTHHGPVMGSRDGRWLSLKANNRSMNGLIQSWQRMKATSLAEFKNTLELKANPSTNTMYADNKGNIAYWHGNLIPERDPAFDWSYPVDGTTSATEWKGKHSIDELVHIENPPGGWIQNCNSTPFSVAGLNMINKNSYPYYMAPEGENFRSIRAVTELEKEKKFTIDKLVALGYDHYLAMFDSLLPSLFIAYDGLPAFDQLRLRLTDAITILRSWDKRSSVTSVATTLAVFWASQLFASAPAGDGDQLSQVRYVIMNTSPIQKLKVLDTLLSSLQNMYGKWNVPWGDINRYQRTGGSIYTAFNDNDKSLPVGLASSFFGSLPSYESVWKGRRKYGVAGNSFVAVVEFGEKINARSVVTGGQSFDPGSKHFMDQAERCIDGNFKEVLFYKADVEKNAEKIYKPGKE